jgi:hypothetical protein
LILPCDPKKRGCVCIHGGWALLFCHPTSRLAGQRHDTLTIHPATHTDYSGDAPQF